MTDFISLNNLHICNIPELGPSFISTTFGKGNPDLTLISSSFQDGIKQWGILDRLSLRDQNRIIKTDWNLYKELVKIWYLAVIEKALLYGTGVWGGALTCEQIKRLHTIQRVFLIKLLRPYRTTATQALSILSGIPPLHVTAKMEYLRFQIWTCRSKGLDGVIDLFKLDKFEKLTEFPLNTRVLELRDKVQDSHFEVYTDGSKVDGDVGFSVCILHGEIQHKIICKKLQLQNTVFQAELAALGEAVDWDIENKKKINIYTDNRSSIEALKNYGSISKFVISIKNKFCLALNILFQFILIFVTSKQLLQRLNRL
ncbi:hypothetical protein AVEN_17203-1 [Araneus ventricosus]|uniref:RNase H type-1 domain-containing protein n=1 Tax=Araneus ventricosus TaxID=182803 RepID=A0A4Y2WS62_ARAVE|nr:hypothetical protein AVEN_17203-1 [Araneus ventricosus]